MTLYIDVMRDIGTPEPGELVAAARTLALWLADRRDHPSARERQEVTYQAAVTLRHRWLARGWTYALARRESAIFAEPVGELLLAGERP